MKYQTASVLLGLAMAGCCGLRDDSKWIPRLEVIVAEHNSASISREKLKAGLGVGEDEFLFNVVGGGEQVILDECFRLYVEPHVANIDGVLTWSEYLRLPTRLKPASLIDAMTLSRTDGRILWRHQTAAYSKEQQKKSTLKPTYP